jgi:hypothetical protein
VDTSALVAAFASPASVEMAGLAPPESVDTEAEEMAGFGCPPRPGTISGTARHVESCPFMLNLDNYRHEL